MNRVRASRIGAVVQWLVRALSGEWMLSWKPHTANGGTVVAARTIWLSFWLYGTAFLFRTRFAEGKSAILDFRQGLADFVDTLPWLATIFGATYIAFYTRFASQWSYVAALYNQLLATETGLKDPSERQLEALAAWKAGFIEDAEELHLAAKPMFLIAVVQWGEDHRVAEKFAQNTVGGRDRLRDLLARLRLIRRTASTKSRAFQAKQARRRRRAGRFKSRHPDNR